MQTIKQTARKAPAPYLARFEHWIDDVLIICWLDFEAGDASVGMGSSAWLVHAYIGDSGMDVAELLADHVVETLEREAAHYLSEP